MAGKTAISRAGKKVNKSQAIIKYHTEHPAAKPREIVVALKRRGVTTNAQYISTILFNYRRKLQASGQLPAGDSPGSGKSVSRNISGVSAKEIILAKQLVKTSGSIGAARRALELYNDIIA